MKLKATNDILCVLDGILNQKIQQFDAIEEKSLKYQEIRNWLIKKGNVHPKLVWAAMLDLIQETEVSELIKKHHINPLNLEAVALLHDLGRLQEINYQTGEFQKNTSNQTHGDVSASILQQQGETDLKLLLPIKYHDKHVFINGLNKDEQFQNLSEARQAQIKFIWQCLCDADRLGNMSFQAKWGVNGTKEALNPNINSLAKISPQLETRVMQHKVFEKEDFALLKTYADVLVVFMGMVNVLHFQCSRHIFIRRYLDEIYQHLLSEIQKSSGTECEKQKALNSALKIYIEMANA